MRNFPIFLAIILAGCGGDGGGLSTGPPVPDGGNGNGGGVVPPESSVYGFEISSASELLTVRVPEEDGMLAIAVDFGNTLGGEIEFEVIEETALSVERLALQAPSSVTVYSDTGEVLFLGTFRIEVTQDIIYWVNVPGLAIWEGTFNVVTDDDTVTARFLGGMISSVELSLNGEEPVSLRYDEFNDLLGDEFAPEWQRRAALASQVLDFGLVQLAVVSQSLSTIDDGLLTVNPAVILCDAFTGTPPEDVLTQGACDMTWLGPGPSPTAGDDFHMLFTDCWFDDEGSAHDALLNGAIYLLGYAGVIDDEFRLIGGGFEEVTYDNLEIAGTVEDPANTFTTNPLDAIYVNGSFSLAFVATSG